MGNCQSWYYPNSTSPRLEIAESMDVSRQLQLRRPSELKYGYEWLYQGGYTVAGTAHDGQSNPVGRIFLRQESNGLHWAVARDQTPSANLAEDVATLVNKADQHELIFQAHPHLHKFPWTAMEATSNRAIQRDLKRKPFRWYKGIIGKMVGDIADKLEAMVQHNAWHHSAMQQTPKHLWRAAPRRQQLPQIGGLSGM
ncbi:hypothetical protein JG687_00017080 [Phytophthora cactorum]|uniref:Uncharacterized protein n=1 Tax=Phytophthora cactorum TaxID=29920 RepID=A0A8T1TR88_9STRA|nr:hypothetical protein GQ600_21856 [Phytophthora cactorum]KAG6945792.1 hypothetical protein JG687_00017080 [Phytophthora cactorum]